MSNVQVQNFVANTSNDQFSVIWKLTRAMKTAGWRYKASSDSSTKDSAGSPASDKWGGGGSVQTATAATITISSPTTTSYGGRSTISGMTGGSFASTSVGHFLTITGATNSANNGTFLITNFISATSVKIENPNAISETTAGTATYAEVSALLDTYPAAITGTSGSGAWWCAQGPSTMKVPIGSSTPTGTFIRGENVTQTTSNATGEILGIVTDTGGQGYLVIAPRLSGTGSGPRGWSSSTVITGDRSGATITPTATVIEYVREIVFWKGNASAQLGHIYFQVIDQNIEGTTTATTGRFSTMAALATATTTICPGGATGGNPTTNGFPTVGTYVPMGQGGSGASGTGENQWTDGTVTIASNHNQLLVTNCIEDSGVSADGTLSFLCSTGTGTYNGWGFHRVDDQEDGDVDPFVWAMYDSRTAGSRTRTAGSQTNSGSDMFTSAFWVQNLTQYLGWRRRGYGGTSDSWLEMQGWASGGWLSGGNQLFFALNATNGNPGTVATTFVTTHVREPIYVAGIVANSKIRKGVLRWWFLLEREATSGTSGGDTFDTKSWIQFSSTNAAVLIGPADGTTTPTVP